MSYDVHDEEISIENHLSLSVPAGRLSGRAEMLPVGFYLDSLSRWKERPHLKDSNEILYFL